MRISATIAAAALLALSFHGCFLEDAVEEALEASAGCSEEDLGKLNEPALPNCSKAVACCKFIKGECGEITLFDFPDEVIQACEANEMVLSELIGEYQGLTEGDCPKYLQDDACAEGLDKTKKNYREVVDQGKVDKAAAGAPSCKLIVEETVIPLNDGLGSEAKYLPTACENVAGVVSEGYDDVTEEPADAQ